MGGGIRRGFEMIGELMRWGCLVALGGLSPYLRWISGVSGGGFSCLLTRHGIWHRYLCISCLTIRLRDGIGMPF